MAAKTKSIKQKQIIPAPPEAVYDCLVNARKHSEFTGAKATGLGRAGCKFTAWDGYISGKHLELDRPSRIVQEWTTSGWPEGWCIRTFRPNRRPPTTKAGSTTTGRRSGRTLTSDGNSGLRQEHQPAPAPTRNTGIGTFRVRGATYALSLRLDALVQRSNAILALSLSCRQTTEDGVRKHTPSSERKTQAKRSWKRLTCATTFT
jgi:uncharacterized protein YndB with AHSA1/START domain